MASRIKKKTTKRAAPRKSAAKRKAPQKAPLSNYAAHWKTYKDLQKKVDLAWQKLQEDVRKKASPDVLMRNKNHLLLLLGECNYMASECMRCSMDAKKRK